MEYFYPPLIGLYAPAMQSGKSVVARYLEHLHGYTIVKFAGPLKDMTRALLSGMGYQDFQVEDMVDGDLKEQTIPGFPTTTPRKIMQTLGTEWGREVIQADLWIEVARQKTEAILRAGGRVVIDDLRFQNEFDFITGWEAAEAWKIIRPGAPMPATDHPSEGLLEDLVFDVVVENDSDLEDLFEGIDEYLSTPIEDD